MGSPDCAPPGFSNTAAPAPRAAPAAEGECRVRRSGRAESKVPIELQKVVPATFLAVVNGIHRSPCETPGRGPVRGSLSQMSIVGRGQNPPETTPVFLEERVIGQALAAAGIAVAVLVLTIQCCRYLFLGAYFDHIEGNVVISGWQYAHGDPLYAMQQGAPRL